MFSFLGSGNACLEKLGMYRYTINYNCSIAFFTIAQSQSHFEKNATKSGSLIKCVHLSLLRLCC